VRRLVPLSHAISTVKTSRPTAEERMRRRRALLESVTEPRTTDEVLRLVGNMTYVSITKLAREAKSAGLVQRIDNSKKRRFKHCNGKIMWVITTEGKQCLEKGGLW